MNKKEIFLFWLKNNRQNFISQLIARMPQIQINDFWQDYQEQTNNELADKIIIWLNSTNGWSEFRKIKFLYNQNAQNDTTETSISNQIALLNGVKPLNTETSDDFINFEKTSEVIEKSFWTGLGDFIGGSIDGDTTTTTTTTTTSKTNGLVIIGAVAGLVAIIVVVSKFL